MNKFSNLTKYLKDKNEDVIKMRFCDIEDIVGFPLPESAHKHRAYFANVLGHSISKAWMEAGYRSANINIFDKTIEFIKEYRFQKTMLSSYIFANIKNYENLLKGSVYLSGIAFCESIFLHGLSLKLANKMLQEYRITVVDDNLKPLNDDSFYFSLNNAKTHCLNIYNSFIKIILFKCLISLFPSCDDRQRIFDAFIENGDIIFDFPYSLKTDVSLGIFAIKLKTIICRVGLNNKYEQIIDLIGKLDYKKMDDGVYSNLSFMEDNYLRDACKSFIQSCKARKPYLVVDYVSELLNVQILSRHDDLTYLTISPLNNNVLIGKILERVILISGEDKTEEDVF